MKPIRIVALAALLAEFLSSAGTAQSGPESFVAFKNFLVGVASSSPADYLGRAGVVVESTEALEEMRHHILSLYDGVQPTNSFLLDSQYVDCIPIEQQPSVRLLGLNHVAAPPPPLQISRPIPAMPLVPLPLELGLSDRFGNPIRCESGTIPMRRITLDELCRFRNLRQYFSKGPDDGEQPPPAQDFFNHKYAGPATQSVNNLGAQTFLNVWYPVVNQGTGLQFSLAQMWLRGGNPLETIEGGWQVAPYHYNTTAAVFFIYWTRDGYFNTGCYNLECAGFVQTSHTVVLGAPNWTGPSVPGGQQVDFHMEWFRSNDGNWWLSHGCDNCFVGYYPGMIYQGGQLSRYATSIAFGGETYSNIGAWPPMGSGAFANAGFGHAAYQSSIYYWDLTGCCNDYHPANLSLPSNPYPWCYTISCATGSCNVFYFGGPGGNC